MNLLSLRKPPRLGLIIGVGVVVIGASFFVWHSMRQKGVPEGIASGNGRIEAVEIDIAAKTAGRVREIPAQRREAEALLRQAKNAIETARARISYARREWLELRRDPIRLTLALLGSFEGRDRVDHAGEVSPPAGW